MDEAEDRAGSPATLRLRCACGWETIGTEEEVVAAAREHGRRLHNMEPTRDEVLSMATATDARDGSPR